MRNFLRRIGDGQGQGFLPTALPGLELYLDSRTLSGLSNGQAIGLWADQSGHGRNVTGNSASLYRANASPKGVGLVGLDEPVLVSPGALLFQSSGSNLPSVITSGATIYLWWLHTGGLIGAGQNPKIFDQPVAPGLQIAGFLSGGQDHFYWNTSAEFVDGNIPAPGGHVWSLQLPPGGTGGNARLDGVPSGDQAALWGDPFVGGIYNLGDSSNTQWTSPYQLGAVLIYSVPHNATTRTLVEAYLRSVWG